MLLILDLDETLIHARNELLEYEPHFHVGPFGIYKRPYLDEFLSFCRENFEVAVWTSSSEDYACEVIENVFEKEYALSFVWARNRCTIEYLPEQQTHIWSKNIKKVKERGYALEQVIAVDDTPEKYKRSYGNLVTRPYKRAAQQVVCSIALPRLLRLSLRQKALVEEYDECTFLHAYPNAFNRLSVLSESHHTQMSGNDVATPLRSGGSRSRARSLQYPE